jgi:hypothetical protein
LIFDLSLEPSFGAKQAQIKNQKQKTTREIIGIPRELPAIGRRQLRKASVRLKIDGKAVRRQFDGGTYEQNNDYRNSMPACAMCGLRQSFQDQEAVRAFNHCCLW